MLTALLVALAIFALLHAAHLVRDARNATERVRPGPAHLTIGFVTNFFDTLGIGNFAPTTFAYRWLRLVRDERIPGTLNVGHTLPVVAMAFVFLGVVEVEATTLVTMLIAAILGAWLGAGIVTRLPKRVIQFGMAIALVAAAVLFTMTHFEAFPIGGDALQLDGAALAVGAIGIFTFGALQTIGIGLYAPCMILVALLGMNPKAAFPIMMGACAFLMPVASVRFVRAGKCDRPAVWGLTIGGLPAVFLAAYLVVSLPLTTLRWLVIAASAISGLGLLRTAIHGSRQD